jgi:4-hydroxyphenylacetate 3-monooxygenase
MRFAERTFRDVLGMFPTGIAVVTMRDTEGMLQGVTVSSFNSVSLNPPLVLFSLSRKLYSFKAFFEARAFAINFLREDQQDLSARFSRALSNKWDQVSYKDGATGPPVLLPALAVLECSSYAKYDGGDHVIMVGLVEHVETQEYSSPLVYFRGRYHKLIPALENPEIAGASLRSGDMDFMRTGNSHLESLRDGRKVYLLGEAVDDVTSHPAFRNATASAAHLYDFQCDLQNLERMTFRSPATGDAVSRAWELPTSYEELVRRREALTAWAETHAGFMGRSPDHVASCISGMYMGNEIFEAFDPKRAKALRDYYEYARDHDLFLTYVIINPQADRSKNPHEQKDAMLTAHMCDQDDQGIIVKGAKMLGTSSIMANEVLVTCIQPLAPGDEIYALSFVVPLNAKGLKLLSRKSYEMSSGSRFDYPLSNQFDENDAVLFFDEVRVPWERVFIAGNIAMCQKQFYLTPAHTYQNYQAQIRLEVKLRFLTGIGRMIASANGIENMPQVRETLGQLAAEAAMVEGLVRAMEVKGSQRGKYFIPDSHTLYAAQVLTQQLYPKVIHTLRDLAGGSLIMLPSGIRDLIEPEVADYTLRVQRSPALEPDQRIKFFKLAWDAVGSEFASRHTQYEMFYSGASFVTKAHSNRTYDWDRATRMVQRVLASYDLEEEKEKWRSTNSIKSFTNRT